jgi:hypothetical protein
MTPAELADHGRTRMILLSALGLTASAASNSWLARDLAGRLAAMDELAMLRGRQDVAVRNILHRILGHDDGITGRAVRTVDLAESVAAGVDRLLVEAIDMAAEMAAMAAECDD